MKPPKQNSQIIRRVEITDHLLRAYLSLNNSTALFFLTTFNKETEKTTIYKGIIPKKSESFYLYDMGNNKQSLSVKFCGNNYGGDIVISLDLLSSITKLFIKVEQPSLKIIEESAWYILHSSPHLTTEKVVALIPCYDVAKYCKQVILDSALYASYVIAINDGSKDATGEILESLASDTIKVITLPHNCGKGVALMKGFQYALDHVDFDVLVTLDGDAQHRPSDIPHLAYLIKKGYEMVIGERLFDLMPPRSRFANRFVSLLLHWHYPHAPFDTQSGMRAFSKNFIEDLIKIIPGGRYEMEFRCLLEALGQQRKITTVPISTTYIEKNVSSHFSPIWDSLRILKVLLSYVLKTLFHLKNTH